MAEEKRKSRRKFLIIGGGVVVVGAAAALGFGALKNSPAASTTASSSSSSSAIVSSSSTATSSLETLGPEINPPTEASAQNRKHGGTLTVSYADPQVFIPMTIFSRQIATPLMFNRLARLESGYQYAVAPDLATSWDISADYKTYTFNLVKNATWHDGKPFTSADVEFTYKPDGFAAGMTAYGQFYKNNVISVDTPDDYTAIFNFKTGVLPRLFFLYGTWTSVYPQHIYDGTDFTTNPANMAPVGTGPFTFVEYVPEDHATFKKNPNYFKKDEAGYQLPYLDKIIYKVIDDQTQRAFALERGEVDYLPFLGGAPYNQLNTIQSNASLSLALASNQGTWWPLSPNIRRDITGNKLVRQAIYYAIDKNTIVQNVTFGHDRVSRGTFSSDYSYYLPDTLVPRYNYNPAMANQLLDQAGYPVASNGSRFSLDMLVVNLSDDVATGQLITQWLKDVNINVTMRTEDQPTTQDDYWSTNPNWDLCMIGTWGAPDPDIALKPFYHSSYIGQSYGNGEGYSNPTIDNLFDKAANELDETTRQGYYSQIQMILADELPLMPLREGTFFHAWNKNMQGIPFSFTTVDLQENAERVWTTAGT